MHSRCIAASHEPKLPRALSRPRNQVVSTVAILEASAQLTETERETLKSAVDPDSLAKKGLLEGARGEIVHERTGELLLDLGFTAAIRKILRLEPQTPAAKKRITGIG